MCGFLCQFLHCRKSEREAYIHPTQCILNIKLYHTCFIWQRHSRKQKCIKLLLWWRDTQNKHKKVYKMLDVKYWCVLGGEIGQVRRDILVTVVSHSVMSSQAGLLRCGDVSSNWQTFREEQAELRGWRMQKPWDGMACLRNGKKVHVTEVQWVWTGNRRCGEKVSG